MEAKRRYFGTDGIRGRVGNYPITPDFFLKLGWALGRILGSQPDSKVLIGKDTRISGYLFESALQAGLASAGADIFLLGPLPTPGVAALTHQLKAQTGVMISASHNPYYDNGVKIFSEKGYKLLDSVELEIEEKIEEKLEMVSAENLGKAKRVNDAVELYAEFCISTLPQDTKFNNLKVVLDCANGATYQVAPEVFQNLGMRVITIGTSPNGLNINQNCGSTKPQQLCKAVLANKADLGIAFDGDGDRVIMVDHKGQVVDGDEILFIIAQFHKQQGSLVGGVVGTLMSNFGLEVAMQNLEIPFTRSKVGDRYVLEELQHNQWLLGGESSGHIINLGKTTTGDGIISALQVLVAMEYANKSLHDLKQGMQKYPQVLINVETEHAGVILDDPEIQALVKDQEQELAQRGRILLRPSGTEPVLRVMVEGNDSTQVELIAKNLARVIERHSMALGL